MFAKHITPQNPLMKAFQFTEDDLVSNRTGMMSAQQYRRMRSRLIIWWVIGFVISGVFVFPCGTIVLLQFQVGAIMSALLGLLLMFGAIALAYYALKPIRQKLMPDIHNGRVLMIDGYVSLRKQDQGSRLICVITINHGQFEVRKDQLEAFQHGVRYRIYYLPRTFLILSAERVW